MSVLGIICEYNPFHSGHKYHIEKSKEICNADTVVAVMSGNFVQRGDVAVFNKELRAKTAILNGVDLVIELPAVMSLCSAERFARCSVSILNSLNVIDYLSFGAENDSISDLLSIAELLACEPESYKKHLGDNLKQGMSYASARCKAVSEILPAANQFLNSPNNILGIEYLKSLKILKSKIVPLAVKRQGSGYNSLDFKNDFISATGARELIFKEKSLKGFVPDNVLSFYNNEKVHSIVNMENAIIANICKMSAEELSNIADVSEGLENKIKKAAEKCSSFESMCDEIKSKRYAHSRIRRILLNSYLGIKKTDLLEPQYIKILDFNEKGQRLLNKAKQEAKLPLAKNYNQIKELNNPLAEKTWKQELVFDRLYSLF